MLRVLLAGSIGVTMIAFGLVSLYEQGLYTASERAQARQLFKLRRFLWLLMTGIGVVSLGMTAVGHPGAVIEYSFSVGFVALANAFVERHLQRALDRDRTPLAQRFHEWWRHPSQE